MTVEADHIVDDVMRSLPATIEVFMRFKMYCVGCPIAPFHTVEEACRAHGIEQDRFLTGLRTAVVSQEISGGARSAS